MPKDHNIVGRGSTPFGLGCILSFRISLPQLLLLYNCIPSSALEGMVESPQELALTSLISLHFSLIAEDFCTIHHWMTFINFLSLVDLEASFCFHYLCHPFAKLSPTLDG